MFHTTFRPLPIVDQCINGAVCALGTYSSQEHAFRQRASSVAVFCTLSIVLGLTSGGKRCS
jgi:hypothetical protein